MKKLAGLLCALALLCGFCLPVWANDTQSATITATVPAAHTLTVQGEGVQVFCNGQSGTSFTVERLSRPQLLLHAESGKTITQVLLNGQDITAAVQGGRYTPEPVYQELSLVVITRDAAATAGDTYTLTGRVTRSGTPVQGITLELRSTLKTTVTDADGRFTFTDVPCGKHSLTALENGNLAGYPEFILFEDANTNFSLNNGVYHVAVNKSEAGVDLALHLTDTDAMELAAGPRRQQHANARAKCDSCTVRHSAACAAADNSPDRRQYPSGAAYPPLRRQRCCLHTAVRL